MERTVLWAAIVAVALGAETFTCPPDESTGLFEDPDSCDLYWECFRGKATQKQCPDGLVFDPVLVTKKRDPCDFIYSVECGTRLDIAPPNSTLHCERQNGLFAHENDCGFFYDCKDGVGIQRQCSPGLHFSLATHTCDWPAAAGREGNCKVLRSIGNFTCDPEIEYFTKDNQRITNPTFVKEDDCAMFYVCKNGIDPAISKCDYGLVYNDITKKCDTPIEVPECATYYDTVEEGSEYYDTAV